MNCYYVYVFLDSSKPGKYVYHDLIFDFEPFYIGKGTSDRINNSKKDKNTYKSFKIKSLQDRGIDIISYKIFDNLTNLESLEVEKSVISKIGRKDMNLGPLVNLTDGGDGRLFSPHSEETKRKISETKKSQNLHILHSEETKETLRVKNQGENNPFFGKHHSNKIKEEHSLRVSGLNHPMFGKKHDAETIRKIRVRRNEVLNQEDINKKSAEFNSKSILQFSLDGEYLNEFSSIKEASKILGISESLIGKTCRGIIKNPRKFIFKFKDEESKVLNNSYEIKIGDFYDGMKLIKRNKTTVIVELSGELLTLRKKNFPYFWNKKSLKL